MASSITCVGQVCALLNVVWHMQMQTMIVSFLFVYFPKSNIFVELHFFLDHFVAFVPSLLFFKMWLGGEHHQLGVNMNSQRLVCLLPLNIYRKPKNTLHKVPCLSLFLVRSSCQGWEVPTYCTCRVKNYWRYPEWSIYQHTNKWLGRFVKFYLLLLEVSSCFNKFVDVCLIGGF